MAKTRGFLLVIASLTIANAASFLTLSHNLVAGVYPVEIGSIGIPLFEGAIISVVILFLLSAAILVPKGRTFGSATSIALCGTGALISGVSTVSWAIPHHTLWLLLMAPLRPFASVVTQSEP